MALRVHVNLVERFFGELTQDVIRDKSFASLRALVHDIEAYLAERNLAANPTAGRPTERNPAQIQRVREALAATSDSTY